MADLLNFRVQQFLGIDSGGTFKVAQVYTTVTHTRKAYLCLFICMTTKAVHFELALELLTTAYLTAFGRFISRRGRCSNINGDCRTNYILTRRYLGELQTFPRSTNNPALADAASNELSTWHFKPPSAPYFA